MTSEPASREPSPRVAHVHPLSLDLFGHQDRDWGTLVRYFLPNLLFALARQGGQHTLHLLTSERRRHSFSVEGVTVDFHPCWQPPRFAGVRRRFARQFSLGMLRAIQPTECDLVHFHASRALHGMLGWVGWRCRSIGLPLVAQDQGNRPVGRLEAALQRWGLRGVAMALAANTEGIAFYRSLGIPPERIAFTPNGFDPEVFSVGQQTAPSLEDPLRLLFVGRFWPDKDPLTMVAAVLELARHGRQVHVTTVGAGPIYEQVRTQLTQGGVPGLFLAHVPQAELVRHYHSAHVLIQTSLGEGFNQVLVEAMACGLPVVANDASGLREPAGNAAILVPVGDAEGIAGAVEKLAFHPEEWQRRRQLGLERARRFTWDVIAGEVHDVYRRVVEQRRVGPETQ